MRKPPSQWKVSELDIILSEPNETWAGPLSPQGGNSNQSESHEGAREPTSSTGDKLTTTAYSLLHLHFEL